MNSNNTESGLSYKATKFLTILPFFATFLIDQFHLRRDKWSENHLSDHLHF